MRSADPRQEAWSDSRDKRTSTLLEVIREHKKAIVTRGSVFGLVLVGLGVYRHFGIWVDEPQTHKHGRLLLDFLFNGNPTGQSFRRYYGPVFAFAQGVIDRVSGSNVLGYQLGHLFGYFLFLLAVLAFYGLCKRQFGGWAWGVLGAAFLVATPRVFSHAFVNPKDAPLMSLMVVAFYFLVRFLESRRTRWIVAAGVASALAVDVRINAIFIVALTAVALYMDAITAKGLREAVKNFAVPAGAYIGTLVPLVILFWPYLWSDPVGHLFAAFRNMAHFPRDWRQLYMGRWISIRLVPWHFIPWWIAITTPIPYLVLAGVGLFSVPVRRARQAFSERSVDRLLVLYGVWLFVPIVYVVITHATLYNEWRQLLFVYPPLVVFAVAGAVRVWRRLEGLGGRVFRLRPEQLWAACLILVLGWVGFRMAELHPYESVYFNSLVGGASGAEGRYRTSVGGLSYKEGFSYVLRSTDRRVRLWSCTWPGSFKRYLFNAHESARLVYVSPTRAKYVVCESESGEVRHFRRHPTVFRVRRDGVTLLYVKKLRSYR